MAAYKTLLNGSAVISDDENAENLLSSPEKIKAAKWGRQEKKGGSRKDGIEESERKMDMPINHVEGMLSSYRKESISIEKKKLEIEQEK